MRNDDSVETENDSGKITEEMDSEDLLRQLLDAKSTKATKAEKIEKVIAPADPSGTIIGELIAMTDEGRTPLVCYPGQPGTAALRARTTVNVHGKHIGKQVVLMFEAKDLTKPIIMGVLKETEAGWPLEQQPGQVEVDVDGERMTVSAKEQLVLQCGKASITLTKAGKVLIKGSYVSSRSSGVNRIKGGSVQLN